MKIFNAVIKYGSIMMCCRSWTYMRYNRRYLMQMHQQDLLRIYEGMFRSIQNFSFSNIDKFSSASLVRLTTDITNVRIHIQMILNDELRPHLFCLDYDCIPYQRYVCYILCCHILFSYSPCSYNCRSF